MGKEEEVEGKRRKRNGEEIDLKEGMIQEGR